MDTNIKLNQINDLDIKQHSFILLTSKRASGKTVLLLDLIKNLCDKYEYDFIVMFSESAKFLKEYDFLDKSFIYRTEEMEDKLKKILQIQERNRMRKKQINGLIILDDVKIHHKSKELINLASMGRHFYLTCLLSTQYPKQLTSSSVRNNLDYIFFSDLSEIGLKAIYESIHVKYSFKEFNNFVNENNHSYQFILNDSRTQNKDERLKIVKAKQYN